MIKTKLSYLCLLLALSCVSAPKQLNPKIYYARDLKLNVNNSKGYGTLVVNQSDEYEIKIKSPGKMSLFILETCHREIPLEDIGKREKMIILPVKGIENEPFCSRIKISAFDKKKGKHSWGVIVTKHPMFTLPAKYKCNGREFISNGSTICQSKENKKQVIEFDTPVNIYKQECEDLERVSDILFEYKMPNRECVYTFQEKREPYRRHYLLTIGYERYPIRE